MNTSNDNIVQYAEGTYNHTKNRWVGKGSTELNNMGVVPQRPALSQNTDETSSMVSTASTDSANTIATDVTLDTNASVGSAATTNTDVDLGGGSNSVPIAPASARSWEDKWNDVYMNATAAYVPKKRFNTINKINFTAQKNKNKYGVKYDRSLPDLASYRDRPVAKKVMILKNTTQRHMQLNFIPEMAISPSTIHSKV
jgi:hypothetical protein